MLVMKGCCNGVGGGTFCSVVLLHCSVVDVEVVVAQCALNTEMLGNCSAAQLWWWWTDREVAAAACGQISRANLPNSLALNPIITSINYLKSQSKIIP